MAIFAVPLGMPVKRPFVTTLKARGSAALSHEAEDLVVFSPRLYKLARHLNDYAHYARRSRGNFADIEDALQESLELKRQGYTLPISLPITHAEYAQFLAGVGQYQEACEQSDLALHQMEQLVQEGYPTARRERAVLQIERGELH